MNFFIYVFLILIAFSFYRLIKGPHFFDRIIALNLISVYVILIMCIYAVEHKKAFYADVALTYALLSFTGMIFFSKFFSGKFRQ